MKNILFVISILLSLWLTSCYEDKGNYTYGDKQAIRIDGLEESYSGVSGVDTLKITPVIVSDKNIVHYEWGIYDVSVATFEEIMLDSVAELCYPIGLPQGVYTLLFRVTDEQGYTEVATTQLSITTAYTEGWLVLKELDNNTELDLYPPGKEPAQDLFSKLYGRALRGKPVGLSMFSVHNFHDTSGTAVRNGFVIFPISEEESPMIRLSDMQWVYDFEDMLYEGPQNGEKALNYVFGANYFKGMITDQYARCSQTNGPPGAPGKWGVPAIAQTEIKLSRYIACTASYVYSTVMYDDLNGAFLQMDNFGTTVNLYKSTDKDKVPVKPFGLNCRLVYMKQTGKRNVAYAILEHKESHERYVFTINTESSRNANPIVAVDTLSAGLKINQASIFSVNGDLPYIYYAVGNECYLYDISTRTEEKINLVNADPTTVNDGDEEITLVEHIYWRGTPVASQWDYFIVATHANGYYKLYLHKTRAGRPDFSEKVTLYQGEGKVAAIHYAMPKMGGVMVSLTYYPYN